MQYTATFNGRMVQATHEIIDEVIVITGVKVMMAGNWDEQTGEALYRIRQWMIAEHGDEMLSSW